MGRPGILALTGGIATGKTTVAERLRSRWRFAVVDADELARRAVAPGTGAIAAIAARYGSSILLPSGELDRSRLGSIIFADPQERAWLEGQIHPFVRERLAEAADGWRRGEGGDRAIVLVVPLLYETGMETLADAVWVVGCDRETQLRRLMARNHLDRAAAEARLNSQWPLEEKIARADLVLSNDGTEQDLCDRVDQAAATWLGQP
ncbi:MAG: dephospho-CoA kinase [Cyanobacteria bacterium]|nr:dephospho-CoA kinase [Cyanobacteriota bacterium]